MIDQLKKIDAELGRSYGSSGGTLTAQEEEALEKVDGGKRVGKVRFGKEESAPNSSLWVPPTTVESGGRVFRRIPVCGSNVGGHVCCSKTSVGSSDFAQFGTGIVLYFK